MNDLKPCPYCGERGEIQETYWPNECRSEWYAWCPGECLTVKPRETQREAADLWNEAVDAINAYRNRTCRKVSTATGGDDNPYACSVCGTDLTTTRVGEHCYKCGARVVSE